MAAIDRQFLGWHRPLLVSVAERWLATHADSSTLELDHLTGVLPVRSAVDRLGVLLSAAARREGVALRGPRLLTIGQLPEQLYEPTRPLAGELQQTLAWTQALRSSDAEQLRPLLPNVPTREMLSAWVDLASLLRRLNEELAAEGLRPSDVIKHVENDTERRRWELIAHLHSHYVGVLREADLADPYLERRAALEAGKIETRGPIELIGCVDFGEQTCRLLEPIAGQLTAAIAAPSTAAALFDRFGRVAPDAWTKFPIELADEALRAAGDATEQAAAAVAALQTWRGADPHERCSVGITDDAFAEVVDTELQLGGMTAHRVAGTSLTRTAPGRLLSLVRDYVGERSWQSLAALIRHPDLLDPLTETLGTNSLTLLGALDQFRNDHQLVRVDDPWPPRVVKLIARQDHAYRLLPRALDWIDRWLAPLRRPATGLAVWCTAVRDVLAVIYPGSDVADCKDGALATGGANAAGEDLERLRGIALAGRLVESLERLAGVPEPLDLHLSAAAALEMLLQRLAEPIPVRDPHADGAVAITGWLDLALDDAAAVAVVGLNHPFVPQAVTADPFLPGALRSRLRVQDNQRRYARDAYALQLVYQSRRRCCLIVGRFGPDASPTPPSRLLAACDPATTVQRIHRLLDEPPAAPRPHSHWEPGREATHLPIPSAAAAPPLTCVSVTAFRDYLACPFRFYLRHVLRLRPLDDAAAELAANQFGDLVHTAVERFGESDDKGLSDPEAIEKSVIAQLQAYAHDEYGSAPAAALRLQIHQAELRLREFAHQQARRIADGWRIEQVEAQVDARHGVGITLEDGQQLLLKGRVDRIDFHPESGRWAILDYKTHGHQPLPAHFDRASGQWLDLQLPLYLQMLPALGIEEPEAEVQLGYFNLAQKASESGVHLAEFTPEELQSAATRARQVARGILAGDYQLDPETGSVLYDDYGMILQTGVAENLWIDEQPEADR